MTRDEIVDFLEWAKECGQLQFPESRKVDMAEMYIKEQDAVNKTCNIPHVTTRFSFKGWADENCHNPKKNCEYLCLVKWYNSSEYQYAVLEYNRKTKWQVTDSCEHILWSELPPSPFS